MKVSPHNICGERFDKNTFEKRFLEQKQILVEAIINDKQLSIGLSWTKEADEEVLPHNICGESFEQEYFNILVKKWNSENYICETKPEEKVWWIGK